jgi:hypothetical protein
MSSFTASRAPSTEKNHPSKAPSQQLNSMTNSSGITSADYIVVGGRIAGCTLAARLQEKLPFASIMLVEAGRDPFEDLEAQNAAGPIQFGTLI